MSNKAAWLASRGLDYHWPAEGFPRLLHSDRAKEFARPSLRRALLNHGVDWFLRPPGRTRYGAHVERLIGSLMGGCKLLPGATHSSPKARGNYDSKAAARLRIDELEMYFAHQILGVYNQTEHSALGTSPLQAWTDRTVGQAPEFPDDMEAFRIDLFPEIPRTLGRQGIKAFHEEYYSQKLGEAYISGLRKVVAKFDPRDLSQLYVKLPDTGYITVPYRIRRDGPTPTWWLLKAAARAATSKRAAPRDRTVVRQAVRAMEETIEQAALRSGSAARQAERLRSDRRAVSSLRDSTRPIQDSDDDWGGAFEGRGA